MSHAVLLLSSFLALASQSVSQTASPPVPVHPADLYAHTFENRVYANLALGLTVKYPEGWDFVDTEILRQKDAEDSKKYRDANPLLVEKGIVTIDISNLFVAQKDASAPVHPMIFLKTQLTDFPSEEPSTYFSENPFFESKDVKFVGKVEPVTKGGRKFAQASIRIRTGKEKPAFAVVLSTVLDNPAKSVSRFVVFQFLADSVEQAQRNSEMIDTIQFYTPSAGAFSQ